MAKGHPYEFTMGHGKSISFQDFKEAGIALMERNMSAECAARQPDSFLFRDHLPKMPRVAEQR